MKKRILLVFMLVAIFMAGCTVQQRTILENSDSSENNSYTPSALSSTDSKKENTGDEEIFYTIDNSPFFDISFDEISKISYYDATMGERNIFTSPQDIEMFREKLETVQFCNQSPAKDPTIEGLTYECLYYFEFFKNPNDTKAAFSIGLSPFYVKTGDNKFGPYTINDDDEIITEILKMVN